jgi:N-acetylneuraminate synthase
LKAVVICSKSLGDGFPCFVIAEAGVNHNGDLEIARRLVDASVKAGADAVKFQAFKAERLVIQSAPKAKYQKNGEKSDSQLKMLKKLELTEEDFKTLNVYSQKKGIIFLASVFDEESTEVLERIGVPAYKMGSGELTNLPLLAYVAEKGKPMIISSGMSTLDEVSEAISTVRGNGCKEIILLHCISNYPAAAHDVNLKVIKTLKEKFRLPIGFSDHTLSLVIPAVAVSMGAIVIEKHITLDHKMAGPDHRASLEPEEFYSMVKNIREVEEALGDGLKRVTEGEQEIRNVARRSLVAAVDIPAGSTISLEMLDVKRPGTGISPKHARKVAGKKAKELIRRDELIKWELLGS